jgi:hypothetical protein
LSIHKTNKHVSFVVSLQNENNNDHQNDAVDTAANPSPAPQHNMDVVVPDQGTPPPPPQQQPVVDEASGVGNNPPQVPSAEECRNYVVITPAEDTWKLALARSRIVARNQARMTHLSNCLTKNQMPLWSYAQTQAPDWLTPMPTEMVDLTHRHAAEVTELARNLLRVRIATDERQANRHLNSTRTIYNEEGDSNFSLATGRMSGIAAHFKSKEQGQLSKADTEDKEARPSTSQAWAENLPRRRLTRPSEKRSRS